MLFSKIIKKKFDAVLGRYDGNPEDFYFSPEDFPDIKVESFDIKGECKVSMNETINKSTVDIRVDRPVTLRGNFYYYDELKPDKLVIFDHGIGAGHLAYFKEIELLAKQGYTVYSYDHCGCVASEGEGIMGFAQGINDLDHVISAILADERFKGMNVKIVGHSWGGYSAMNNATLHSEVTHVVSLAGFLSARALIEQYLPKFVMKYSDEVMDRERRQNPKYADMDARESIARSMVKLFHIQSKDDQMVKYDLCFTLMEEGLRGREDTVLVSVDNKSHDPFYTERAVKLENEKLAKQEALKKKGKLSTREEQDAFRESFDWNAMSEEDMDVWQQIFDFLES